MTTLKDVDKYLERKKILTIKQVDAKILGEIMIEFANEQAKIIVSQPAVLPIDKNDIETLIELHHHLDICGHNINSSLKEKLREIINRGKTENEKDGEVEVCKCGSTDRTNTALNSAYCLKCGRNW